MYDLEQFSEAPIPFSVEFQGQSLDFYVKPTSMEEFFAGLKKGAADGRANMRRTFLQLLLDEDEKPVTKEWVDKLLTKPNLIPLGIKINAALNSALGLDDLTAKKA